MYRIHASIHLSAHPQRGGLIVNGPIKCNEFKILYLTGIASTSIAVPEPQGVGIVSTLSLFVSLILRRLTHPVYGRHPFQRWHSPYVWNIRAAAILEEETLQAEA